MDEDDYLQRITELVYDDNEILTATAISKILQIKIHKAQSLLDKYIKNADVPGQTDLSWTFTVIGTDKNDGFSITIAKQDELENVKAKLKTVLSEHVFSVQKHGDIDLVILANVEPFTENKVRTAPLQGSVLSKNAIKRKLKKQVVATNEIKQDINKVENKQNESVEELKSKRNGIESFCTKGSAASSTQSKPLLNSKAKQKNMMTNFFSKSNSSNKIQISNGEADKEKHVDTKPCSNEIKENITENIIEEAKMNTDDELLDEAMDVCSNENETVSKNEEEIKQQVKKSKKRKSNHKSSQASKKRKRIVEAVDSDSDIFASSESEVEVVPDINFSDDNYEEETKSQPIVPTKARRMKQITEEFVDEDGYMNTVQKYVFVSDDEVEENKEHNNMNTLSDKPVTKTKAPSPPSNLTKTNKNTKSKTAKTVQNQPTIMNFFKKA
ncbi:hypothetical protein Trydic_g7828 [Trypoxylus dichotomus]